MKLLMCKNNYTRRVFYEFEKNEKRYKETSTTLSGLSKGYTYYVKIRAYKKSNGTKIYSDYGSVKKVYIKK